MQLQHNPLLSTPSLYDRKSTVSKTAFNEEFSTARNLDHIQSPSDTSARRRDPNQGDVRKRRGFNCSVGGGFSSLLPCPLILSDSVLLLAYGNGGLQFLGSYFQITITFWGVF
ncbi:hypothetical protein PO909_032663 [Leuciscus waleckii]